MSWLRRAKKKKRKVGRRRSSGSGNGWEFLGDILDAIADFIN